MKCFTQILVVFILFALPGTGYAALGDYFVSTNWLADNRDQVIVVDVRKSLFYRLGHVAGAQHVERDAFLATRNQVKSLVPSSAAITALLSRLGATSETPLVIYAEDDNPYAARFVWTLRYHGHKNSYVLDGGYNKWVAEDRDTSLLPSSKPQPSKYTLAADGDYLEARADADYIYTRLGNPGVLVWDTRSDAEFAGTDVRANRGGHIPGAVHFNWSNLQTEVNGVKILKSREEIVAQLQAYGLTPDKEIVAHCQTGIRSSYATLVLLGLGYERVRNYDGSWIEWANNATLPIINAAGRLENPIRVSMD
ncbi:MAG: sulfurtransferase [Desulfuromusa sp.]|nr:sulfurtransferase [Desulfuromusa sp.]